MKIEGSIRFHTAIVALIAFGLGFIITGGAMRISSAIDKNTEELRRL